MKIIKWDKIKDRDLLYIKDKSDYTHINPKYWITWIENRHSGVCWKHHWMAYDTDSKKIISRFDDDDYFTRHRKHFKFYLIKRNATKKDLKEAATELMVTNEII